MAPLATVNQLISYLKRSPADAEMTQAELLLDSVSDDVRSYCGWSISAEAGVAWTLDGDGSTMLGLPTLRLTGVTSVVSDGVTLVEDTDFEWSQSGFLVKPSFWPRKLRSVVATADHGYDPVPREVALAVCSMVSRLMSTAGKGSTTSIRIGDYSETQPNTNLSTGAVGPDMPGASPTELAILNRYWIPDRP